MLPEITLEKAKIVMFDGSDAFAAGYSSEGRQVAWAHLTLHKQLFRNPSLPVYEAECYVGTLFQGQGFGFTMLNLLENYVAAAFRKPAIGISVVYVIRGTTEKDRGAMSKVATKLGALQVPSTPNEPPLFHRTILQPWYRGNPVGLEAKFIPEGRMPRIIKW